MGIYGEGGSNAPTEPAIGHPVHYPPNPYTQAGPYAVNQASYEPPPAMVVPNAGRAWATALCGCCSDCDICCQTCWCPCVSFGQIAEIVEEGRASCCVQGAIYGLLCAVGIPCVYSFMWRQKLRRKYGLERGCCGDFCVHCCCPWCALCQEHRELSSRGLDPSLGWEAAQQNHLRAMAAPTATGAMMSTTWCFEHSRRHDYDSQNYGKVNRTQNSGDNNHNRWSATSGRLAVRGGSLQFVEAHDDGYQPL